MEIRTFQVQGRRVAWFAALLGVILVADAVWSVSAGHVGPAFVVGAIGVERLLHAAAHYWNGRYWPWRLRSMRLTPEGLEFEEANVRSSEKRTTTLPAGLILEADVDPGHERRSEAEWVTVLYTILGVIIWSEHRDRDDAESAAEALERVLARRGEPVLEPPTPTGTLDIIGSQRAVMWGKPPLIPIVTIARCLLLLAAIFTLPALVAGETLVIAAWSLVVVTVALLTFPFLGAAAVLMHRGGLIGHGAAIQEGELRTWEASAPRDTLPISRVRHIGFDGLRPSGETVTLRLVAHTAADTPVESYVATSTFVQLATEAYRLVARGYDVDAPHEEATHWSVRLPGGVAEAIEAVSWMQRFAAEARDDDE